MSAFPWALSLDYEAVQEVRSDQRATPLGAIGYTPDGNRYRWCKAGATELAAGLFTTFITVPANEQTVTVAHAAGTRTVTVTSGTTTLNQYAGGRLVVTAGPDAGSVYRIKSNSVDATNVATFVLANENGLNVAWTTSTDVDVFPNPYNGLVICPTDGQQLAVALTQRIIPANNFFWGLDDGFGSFMCDNAAGAVGLELDEKNILQSLNHAGQGFLDTSPDATKILAGYRQVLGYLVTEEDTVDNEMEFGRIRL